MPMNRKKTGLLIASCQFAVGPSAAKNFNAIVPLAQQAKEQGAVIAHFSECALCGYAGVDHASLADYDWDMLSDYTQQVCRLARKLKLWLAMGSMHRNGNKKPFNSLYLISPQGDIVDRYDKRFGTLGDLKHYTPGNRFVIFELNGIRCALLICFDLRFPELYRELARQNVQCILQSFYNARQTGPSVHTHIMRQTMQCHAATNYFWVSMTNSSARYAPYPSCFIEPDGVIAAQLPAHRAGVMVNTVEPSKIFYDPSAPFRPLALAGKLTNRDYCRT